MGFLLNYPRRWRTDSYNRMEAAAEALREVIFPFMGM
jgi:hypothetical protein